MLPGADGEGLLHPSPIVGFIPTECFLIALEQSGISYLLNAVKSFLIL